MIMMVIYFCVHGAHTGLNGPCIQKSDCVGKVLQGALRDPRPPPWGGPSSPPSDFAHRVRFLAAESSPIGTPPRDHSWTLTWLQGK